MNRKRIWSLLSTVVVAVALVFVIRAINPAQASFTLPDPCASQQRTSASVSITTATTTRVVQAATGQGIYVCGEFLNVSTASATVQWEYGTQVSTPCDTGTTVLTGAVASPASVPTVPYINVQSGLLLFSVPAGNQLCLVSGGTTPGIQGFVTYVQG